MKIFDLESDTTAPIAKLVGHEMPISSINYREGKIASAGRDCTTRVWDIETERTICKRKIDRNMTT